MNSLIYRLEVVDKPNQEESFGNINCGVYTDGEDIGVDLDGEEGNYEDSEPLCPTPYEDTCLQKYGLENGLRPYWWESGVFGFESLAKLHDWFRNINYYYENNPEEVDRLRIGVYSAPNSDCVHGKRQSVAFPANMELIDILHPTIKVHKMNNTITPEQAKEMILNSKGRFFSVTFTKKDKTKRDMNCTLNIQKRLVGGKSTIQKDYQIPVLDTDVAKQKGNDKAIRSFDVNTLTRLKIAGEEYKVA